MTTAHNNYKSFLGIFISLWLCTASLPGKACGGDWYWDIEFYRFFEPELLEIPGYTPFHYSFSLLYDYEWTNEDNGQESNLKAWQDYLNNEYTTEDIRLVVYGGNEEKLEGLRQNPSQGPNRFRNALSEGKHPAVLDYLILATKCEPFNNDPDSWREDRPLLPSADHSLVQGLRQGYQAAPDDRLKMRYAFQLVRLLHYAGFFKEAVAAYEQLAAPLRVEGLIEQWTRSQYAGALHGLNQLIPAAYHFSRVFDQCLTLRPQAWYSYDVPDQATWDGALALCKNPEEKANLYFMRAITPDAVSTEEIRNIQKILPGSEKVDLLLVREINKLEEQILGGPEWDFRNSSTPNLLTEAKLDLHQLVKQTQASGDMYNRQIWDLADAYLEFLGGKPNAALDKLSNIKGEDFPETQSQLLNLAIRIAQMRSIDLPLADAISKDLKQLMPLISDSQQEELNLYYQEYMSAAYTRAGRPGMALLASRHADWVTYEPNYDIVEEMMLFYKQEEKSFYEQELFGHLSNNYSYDDLLEVKGTLLFAENQIEEAIAVFKQLPAEHRAASSSFTIGPDPFAAKARDIINCDPDCIVNKFTKLSLAQTIIKLKEKAKNEPQMAGHYYHLLGNAYFTTTYFGACWEAKDYYRSSYIWGDLQENEDEVVDVGIALSYYQKSIEASNNREIAALSCLMAAKAFAIDEYYPDLFPSKEQEYQPYYTQLMNEFGDTDVYEMAVLECQYFAFFVDR